ncbi:MAG: hypothetical protein EBR34_11815 [Sphingomonadaceae bacterium]|nr:hypothetical protein [Sphingomonadaceae bacterium]
MRRAAPSLPISPRLLKHFAAATLALTICIAIFADGSTTEAVAETVKSNELKKTEVDMLGSRKLAQRGMKVRAGSPMPIDEPDFSGGSSGGGFYNGAIAQPAYVATGPELGMSSARPEDMLPGGELAKKARQTAQPRRLTPKELAQLREASRLRTGSAAVN